MVVRCKKSAFVLLYVFLCIGVFAKSKSLDDVLSDAAEKFIAKAKPGTEIVIGEINAERVDSSKSIEFENYVRDFLQDKIVDSEKVTVVERSQTDAIVKERDYQQSGAVRDEDWAEIGAEIGAQYVIYGEGRWKTDSYVLTLKMTNVETAKIDVSFRDEVTSRDKELKRMLGLLEQKSGSTKQKKKGGVAQRFTVGLTGGAYVGGGTYGSHGEDVIKNVSTSSAYSASDNAYNSFTGNLFCNFRLGHGFGVESGVGFWNGGGELLINRKGNLYYAEKYKFMALDVPVCLTFQFKLFRTSLKFLGGLNFSVPVYCVYEYEYHGTNLRDKQTVSNNNFVIPGIVFGADYLIPLNKHLSLDFTYKFEKDFNPYEIIYNSESLELFKREGSSFMVGIVIGRN